MAVWDFTAAQTGRCFCPLAISLWTCSGGHVPSASQLTFFKHKNVRWLIALPSFILLCNSSSCEMLGGDMVRKRGCQMRKGCASYQVLLYNDYSNWKHMTLFSPIISVSHLIKVQCMSLSCVLLPLCYFCADYQKQLQHRWWQRQLFCGLVFPPARVTQPCFGYFFLTSLSSLPIPVNSESFPRSVNLSCCRYVWCVLTLC